MPALCPHFTRITQGDVFYQPNISENQYLTLKEYDRNIHSYYRDYNGINALVMPLIREFAIHNASDTIKQNAVVLKTVGTLELNTKTTIENNNQVQMYCVSPASVIEKNYPLFFVVDTDYYDVTFLSEGQTNVFVGQLDQHYVVQILDWLFKSIYVVLTPKEDGGVKETTSITYYKEKLSEILEINENTIYPILRRLTNQALFNTYQKESELGPPRKYYQITQKGHEKLKIYLFQWRVFLKQVSFILGGQDE